MTIGEFRKASLLRGLKGSEDAGLKPIKNSFKVLEFKASNPPKPIDNGWSSPFILYITLQDFDFLMWDL